MLLDKSQQPRLFILFIGLLLLGYGFYRTFLVTQDTIAAMVSQGWNGYLELPSTSLGVFTTGCLSDPACRTPFMEYWSARFPWWWLLAGVGCLIASTLMMFFVDSLPKGADKAPGGAKWAKDRDLTSLLKPGKGNYASPLRGYLGHTTSGKMLQSPENKRNAHSLIIGGPGSGKTTRYFKQNLLQDALQGMSCVVLDLKYPDARGGFFDMVPFFESQGADVQLFLPFDDKTLSMPLLLGADTFEGASEFARMVVPIDLEGGDGEFYRNQERKLLTGLVMALTRNGETSLRKLYRLLVAGKESVAGFVKNNADQEVQALFKSFFELDAGKLAGIINGLEGKLQIFYDEGLDKATANSDYPWENVDLETLGTKASLLYIGIPQEKLLSGDGKLLLQLIKRTLDRAMLKNARANNGSLPVATSFYLDEFPSFGELPNMEENFATMRSYKVGYHVAIQNRAQLEAVYGREAANALLTNLFQHIVLFPRYLKFDDATFFSEALGEMTVIEESRGRRASVALLDLQQNTVNRKEVALPLMSLEEMMSWPDAVGVVIANGMPPIKTLMPRLDESHVEGKRNRLHEYYAILQNRTLDVVKLRNELLLRRHATIFKQLAPTGALTDILQTKQQRKEKTVSVQAVGTTSLKETFLVWLDQVIAVKPKTYLYLEEGSDKVTKIAVDVSTLPDALKEPKELKSWLQERYLKVQRERYGLVGEALAALGQERKEKLIAFAARDAKLSQEARATPAPTKNTNPQKKLQHQQSQHQQSQHKQSQVQQPQQTQKLQVQKVQAQSQPTQPQSQKQQSKTTVSHTTHGVAKEFSARTGANVFIDNAPVHHVSATQTVSNQQVTPPPANSASQSTKQAPRKRVGLKHSEAVETSPVSGD